MSDQDGAQITQYIALAGGLVFLAVWFATWGFWQWLIFDKELIPS